MKGLLIKELITNIKNNKISLIIIPFFAIFGLLNKQNMFLMIIPVLLSMLPIGQMSYDEMSHWDKYVYCMPVNKRSIVSSKYLSVLIMSLLSAVIVSILMVIASFITHISANEVIFMSIAAVLIGSFVPCISLPINYKFGTTKGRIVYLIIIAATCGIVPGIILSDSVKLSEKAAQIFSNAGVFCAASLGVLAVMLLISWFISIKIYETKEV